MEDLDHEREVADAAVDILATLDTFGFESVERVVDEKLFADAHAAAFARPVRPATFIAAGAAAAISNRSSASMRIRETSLPPPPRPRGAFACAIVLTSTM